MISFKDYFIECMVKEEEPTEEDWLALIELADEEEDDDDRK